MARGVKLVSQFAVLHDSTREVTRSTSFLREAMEKALVTMSADIEARAKSMTSLGRGLLPTWSFGTVVRNPLNEHVAMVIRDMGETDFIGMILSARQQGNVLRLRRGSWNPVED